MVRKPTSSIAESRGFALVRLDGTVSAEVGDLTVEDDRIEAIRIVRGIIKVGIGTYGLLVLAKDEPSTFRHDIAERRQDRLIGAGLFPVKAVVQ